MTTSPAPDADGAGPAGITPDDKDWTWTLERPCPECGFEAAAVAAEDVAGRIRAFTDPWPIVLGRSGVRERPDPATWSVLEYACHVRDVCRLFDRRLRSMLEQDDPLFEDWDQDRTAVQDRYGEQDPADVASTLAVAAAGWADTYAAVGSDEWDRTGTRSNGSRFTVLSLGRYGLHDLAHHLHDVGVAIP
jgi:DinB superfamily